MRLDEQLTSGDATLLVFSPDAIESRVVSSIERWIRDRTDCVPVSRHWFAHTDETIELFYQGSIPQMLPHWHLVSELFQSGPSLATIWSGKNSTALLGRLKGRSHPAIADAASIRGQFWCDNPVANLVHVSDNPEEATREVSILRRAAPNIFMGEVPSTGLLPFASEGPVIQRHSGVLTLCSLAAKVLGAQGRELPYLGVPQDGDARETMNRAVAWLQQVRGGSPPAVDAALGSFVDGTADAAEFLSALGGAIPFGPWDRLVLRCGIVSRKKWLDA